MNENPSRWWRMQQPLRDPWRNRIVTRGVATGRTEYWSANAWRNAYNAEGQQPLRVRVPLKF